MSLSPTDVDSMEFRQPSQGGRGYSEADVDTFLDDVAEEMRRLAGENEALAQRLQRDDLAGHLRRLERDRERAEERFRALEAELERARSEARAREEARSRELEPAWNAASGAHGPHILELARRNAEEHLADAHRAGAEVLRKAAIEAARLVSDAELRASTIVADARHAHVERIAGLGAKRAEALNVIDDLVETARSLRESVTDEMGRCLRGMDGGAPAVTRPRGAP